MIPNIRREKPGAFGTERLVTSVVVGTGGTSIGNTATTSVLVPVPRASVQIASISINALVAAASSGTVTATVFKRDNQPASPADVALNTAISLKSDVVTTLDWTYDVPIITTLTVPQRRFQLNDACRVDLIASGTVSTQPTVTITIRWDALT